MITNKEDLLMIKISQFFYNIQNINMMIPIVNGESDSLRIMIGL